jgi:hypothetical protein
MLGIPAASNSMAMPSGRRNQGGDSSVRNRAMPKLTGTAMTSAISDVTGAVDGDHGAEALHRRIPFAGPQKRQAEFLDRRPCPLDQRNDDRHQHEQCQQGETTRQVEEYFVADVFHSTGRARGRE